MVKRNKKKILCVLSCMASLLLGAGVIGNQLNERTSAVAQECTLAASSALYDTYYLNETIDLSNAKISYESNEYAVEQITVAYPDGNSYGGRIFTLDQLGEYTIDCRAKIGGETVRVDKTLSVYNQAYTVTAEGACEYKESIAMVTNESVAGLEVSLNNGSVFTYNKAMDIAKLDKAEPFVVIYPHTLSQNLGMDQLAQDTAYITVVRLTDCNDSSTYIDFEISWDLRENSQGNPVREIYFRAGANNQMPVGLMPNSSGTDTRWYQNLWYKNSKYIGYGKEITSNGMGPYGAEITKEITNCDNMGIGLYFNNQTGDVYAEYMGEDKRIFVTNVYSAEIYPNSKGNKWNLGAPFEGFTTGEVYLSVFGEQYLGNQLKVDISSIFGQGGDGLNATYAVDEQAPIFNETFASTYSIVAKNEEVCIPVLDAYDVNGVKSCTYSVFYEYGTKQQTTITTVDGLFAPMNLGTYSVIYTAEDIFGNKAILEHKLLCKMLSNNEAMSFVLEQDTGTFNPTNTTETLVGQLNILPEYKIESANAVEDVYCRMYTVYEETGEEAKVDLEVRSFMFENVGSYKLVIEYGDRFHQYVKEYAINSKISNIARVEAPILPEYFIKDAEYTLDINRVISYDSVGRVYSTPEVYKAENGGEFERVDTFPTVKFTQKGTAQLQYRYKGEVLDTVSVSVVDVNFGQQLNFASYFQGNAKVDVEDAHVMFSVRAGERAGSVAFINALSYSNFGLEFMIAEENSAFGEFAVRLIDYYDRTNVEEIVFKQDSNSKIVIVHNGVETSTNFNFAGTSKQKLDFADGKFMINSSIKIDAVNGFATDKMLVHFEVRNMFEASTGENAAVAMRSLCGLRTSKKTVADSSGAKIVQKQMLGLWEKDAILTLKYPDVTDILSPFVQSGWALSVYDTNGEAVKDIITGNELKDASFIADEMQIQLEVYGIYTIYFKYVDQAGNESSVSQNIYVAEEQAPEITLNGIQDGAIVKGKVGDKINVFDYSVVDNVTATENLKVKITVVLPSLRMEHIGEDKVLVLTQQGKHTVYYTVVDEVGNMAMCSYIILVE